MRGGGPHASAPAETVRGAYDRATKCVMGCAKMKAELHSDCATGAFGRAPYGATNRGEGCAEMKVEMHADCATGSFGGAPCGAMKRLRACLIGCGYAMRTVPQGLSVEILRGPRSV